METIKQVDVKAKFRLIYKLSKEMKKMIEDHTADTMEGNNLYYTKLDIIRNEMRELLRLDFRVLNERQLLTLCSLVSSYRPVEPHSFLTTCSILNDKP